MNTEISLHDAADLLSRPAPPVEWFVDRLIPMGTTMDLFSPPGVGKTSLLTDLALTIAAALGSWHGRACVGGSVVILGGERTNADTLARDLHRAGRPAPQPGDLTIPHNTAGDCPPLWAWDKKTDDWHLTAWGCKITEWLTNAPPAMVILDTIMSSAAGCDLLDQPQQYSLGQTIRQWTRLIGAGLTITASHTNQASASAALHDRLDYLSRAGGNGLPGAIRHIAGMTKLRKGEVPGFDPVADGSMFAIGFSKHNECPPTDWTHHHPAIFTQGRGGKLALLADSQEVGERLTQAADKGDEGGTRGGKIANAYKSAKSGERRAYATC